jgi:predicted nucleic acid-binding protein
MQDTRELWRQAKEGKWKLVTSIITERELQAAPPAVRELFEDTFRQADELLAVTVEAETLAHEYLKARVVSERYADDALHVAVCTVHRINFLVSWNFRHLVNVQREAGFNAVNLLQGYPMLSIVNPKEIIHAHAEDEP